MQFMKEYLNNKQLIEMIGAPWLFYGVPLSTQSCLFACFTNEIIEGKCFYLAKKGEQLSILLFEKLKELGGQIHYKSEVKNIEVQDGKITGVRNHSREEIPSKHSYS